ncbi:hypothetical protein F5Y19DRAFT_473390 [Xylariaceae sp. FL1651]|nr:hypothetical protein F5Y19DRAFT_473390 [Xylariaceae sp. FL1651]
MADPLSVAGLAAGVVSLGLQVVGGLLEYLDAMKARPEELNAAKQQANDMKGLLLTIQDLLPQIEKNWPASANTVEHHVNSCRIELSALNDLLLELSQPEAQFSSIRVKFVEQKKKLSYPFNRSYVGRLESRLAKVNSSLQTALQIAALNVSITSWSQINRIHDLLLASSKKAAVEAESSMTRLSVTMANASSRELAKGTKSALNSVGTTLLFVSKPSYLSAELDTLAQFEVKPAAKCLGSHACSCKTSQNISRRRNSWGALSVISETATITSHLSDCPYSQFSNDQHTTSLVLEYRGLRNMLQKAVRLSFLLSHGAGGFSISPNFTYYPSVNEAEAPTFRIMTLAATMARYTYLLSGDKATPEEIDQIADVLQLCFDGVLSLYRKGKASPRDVDSLGRSLMSFAIRIRGMLSSDMLFGRIHLVHYSGITKLVACQVPVAIHDIRGLTPCGYIVANHLFNDYTIQLLGFLTSTEPDVPLRLVSQRVPLYYLYNTLPFLATNTTVAEASECGPLSLAAMNGNESVVRDLLIRQPQALKEVNQFGQNPLHLAIQHPLCVRLIGEACGQSILNGEDATGRTPLEAAVMSACAESVCALIELGCRIDLNYTIGTDIYCLTELFKGMKDRRDELRSIALKSLPNAMLKTLRLHDGITLDHDALKIQELLQERGIKIPSRLQIVESWGSQRSVYYYRLPIQLYDKLWTLGFRDINTFSPDGELPLTFGLDHYLDQENQHARYEWLIEHGADYWTPFGERKDSTASSDSVTPAHFLFAYIGQHWNKCYQRQLYSRYGAMQRVAKKILEVHNTDTCSCQCSAHGCTPLKVFLEFMMSGLRYKRFPAEELAREFVNFLQTIQLGFTKEDYTRAIEYMTFEALDLTHTCCRFTLRDKTCDYTFKEIEAVDLEQSTLLDLFNELVAEFEELAGKDQFGTPLVVCDPETFWIHHWLPRMNGILDGLNGANLSEQEKAAATAIGVVWDTQPTIAPAEVYPEYTPEYVRREVQKILNES